MLIYQFITKRKKQKTLWQIPRRRKSYRPILDKTIYDDARRVIGREHWIIQKGAGVQPLGGGTSNIAPPKLLWSTKTEYNAAGQVIREIDQNGLETLYIYDVRGLETEVRSQSRGSDGNIIWSIQRTVYDAAGRSTYRSSYTEGIPATQIYGSHTEYDGDGRSVRSEQLLGLVIEIGANGQSFVKSIGTVLSSSSTVYNSAGWVLSSTDSYGLVTQYTYNVFGETTQTRRQLIGGGWIVSETVYDSQGRVIFSTDSHLEGSTDPIYGTKSIYDSQGRSVGSVRYQGCEISLSADGTSNVTTFGTEVYRTSTEYDSKGRVHSSTDALGNITIYEYDNLDRQVIVKQANGFITETVYNSKGQVWKSIIRAGDDVRTTEYKYDMFGNIIETIQPDGTTIKAEYNDKGQKISETNQLGQTRYFEYDDNGQLIKVTLPEVNGQSPVYEYTYDAQGNQLTIKDPNGNVTKFTYDDNGNQLTRTLPDGSTEYFEYDYKGRMIKQTSFEGVVTTYQYDSYDRLSTKTFTQNGISETWTYTYDAFSRVSEIDQDGRITKTTYDLQGRTILIETPEGTILYTYDKYGNQATVQTDNDNPVYYTYDRYGRLATVSHDNKTTYYEYDTFGNLAKEKLPNGVITTYEYDNMNRLIKLTNFSDKNNNGIFDNGEGVSEFKYDLDNLGRKDYAFEKFWTEYGLQENEIDWKYDEAGRLIYEKFDHYNDEFDQTSEWIYDLVGNRLKQSINGKVTTYDYDVNDRLLHEISENKTTIYDYDHTQQTNKSVSENGFIVSETTFEYDAQGRMSVVTVVAGNRIEKTIYEYGADGIRVSAEQEIYVNGELTKRTKTEYLNDPLSITGYSQVLKQTETDMISNEETVTRYVIGHQRISQIVIKNGTEQEYYFTFDGHGSTRVLVDFYGAIVQLYSFDAYGNALGFNPAEALTEFLYSGEQFDSKIGQQYLRARYYDPTTGRFNRLDPFFGNLNDPQSLQKYLYVHDNPINGIDPSGLFSIAGVSIGTIAMASMKCAVVGGIIGFGAGFVDAKLGGASWTDAAKTGAVSGLIGIVIGTALGPIGAVAYGGYGVLQALAISVIFHAEILGVTLGMASIVESIKSGNLTQAAFRAILVVVGTKEGIRQFSKLRPRIRPLGDFTNIQGKTIPDILEAIPPNAKRRSFTPQSGKVQEGVEYKWVDNNGKKWMVEIHGPDASPQAMGGNASQGWVVRIRLNGKYLDHNGIPHPQGISSPNSINYDPIAANNTHIPIQTPKFPQLFVK